MLLVWLKYCRHVVFPLAMFPSTQIWRHKRNRQRLQNPASASPPPLPSLGVSQLLVLVCQLWDHLSKMTQTPIREDGGERTTAFFSGPSLTRRPVNTDAAVRNQRTCNSSCRLREGRYTSHNSPPHGHTWIKVSGRRWLCFFLTSHHLDDGGQCGWKGPLDLASSLTPRMMMAFLIWNIN